MSDIRNQTRGDARARLYLAELSSTAHNPTRVYLEELIASARKWIERLETTLAEVPDAPAFSAAALENIAETGADWKGDLRELRASRLTADDLLAHCLNGADADREQGWRDYVDALVAVDG